MRRLLLAALFPLAAGLCACATASTERAEPKAPPADARPSLGNFSVSLAVKDLAKSRAFYEALGFRAIAGDAAQNWLVLQSDTATIGLFQGLFERNTLTFNPGWDREGNALADFTDVRDLQRELQARGLTFVLEADTSSTGPAHAMLIDPDGNPILLDQHVPRPRE